MRLDPRGRLRSELRSRASIRCRDADPLAGTYPPPAIEPIPVQQLALADAVLVGDFGDRLTPPHAVERSPRRTSRHHRLRHPARDLGGQRPSRRNDYPLAYTKTSRFHLWIRRQKQRLTHPIPHRDSTQGFAPRDEVLY